MTIVQIGATVLAQIGVGGVYRFLPLTELAMAMTGT